MAEFRASANVIRSEHPDAGTRTYPLSSTRERFGSAATAPSSTTASSGALPSASHSVTFAPPAGMGSTWIFRVAAAAIMDPIREDTPADIPHMRLTRRYTEVYKTAYRGIQDGIQRYTRRHTEVYKTEYTVSGVHRLGVGFR
eukprot:1186674-Prorocentrum_minimum.AAC.1